MILGEAMPKQIADSYFGLCRLFGDLDKKTEQPIESKLRWAVAEVGYMRNDIAHGDWWVGHTERHDSPTVRPPILVRTQPGRVEGPAEKEVELTVTDLETMADDIWLLTNVLTEFGHVAMRLPVTTNEPIPPATGTVSVGTLRVSDLYRLDARSKAAGGARIVRDGAQAGIVPVIRWVGERALREDETIELTLERYKRSS
jgi:hypothetical protein